MKRWLLLPSLDTSLCTVVAFGHGCSLILEDHEKGPMIADDHAVAPIQLLDLQSMPLRATGCEDLRTRLRLVVVEPPARKIRRKGGDG